MTCEVIRKGTIYFICNVFSSLFEKGAVLVCVIIVLFVF